MISHRDPINNFHSTSDAENRDQAKCWAVRKRRTPELQKHSGTLIDTGNKILACGTYPHSYLLRDGGTAQSTRNKDLEGK